MSINSQFECPSLGSNSLAKLVFKSLEERDPLKECLIDSFSGRKWKRSQVLESALNLANYLKEEESIERGDLVLIVDDNNDFHAILMIGILFVGGIYCSLPRHSTEREIKQLVELIRPKLLITDLEIGFKSISVKRVFQMFERKSENKSLVETGLEDVITLVITSGSSGLPKAIKRTNLNILSTIAMFTHPEMQPFTEEDVILSTGFCHICGQRLIFSAIASGSQVVIVPKDENHEQVFDAIHRFGVTATVLVPTQLNWLVKNKYPKEKISSLQDVMTGAAPLSSETHRLVEEMFGFRKFRNSYGMSESGFVLMVPLSSCLESSRESVGKVVPGFEVKVIDEKGNSLKAGEIGEICMKGSQVMNGYLKEEMFETFDGFLRSGDLGFFDEKLNFFCLSRIKDIIKCDGVSVAPSELEHVLLSHLDVENAAVVALDDSERGQIPKAFVTLVEGSLISEEELKEWANERLNDYKKLRGGIKVIKVMPKTHSGKIRKSFL